MPVTRSAVIRTITAVGEPWLPLACRKFQVFETGEPRAAASVTAVVAAQEAK